MRYTGAEYSKATSLAPFDGGPEDLTLSGINLNEYRQGFQANSDFMDEATLTGDALSIDYARAIMRATREAYPELHTKMVAEVTRLINY